MKVLFSPGMYLHVLHRASCATMYPVSGSSIRAEHTAQVWSRPEQVCRGAVLRAVCVCCLFLSVLLTNARLYTHTHSLIPNTYNLVACCLYSTRPWHVFEPWKCTSWTFAPRLRLKKKQRWAGQYQQMCTYRWGLYRQVLLCGMTCTAGVLGTGSGQALHWRVCDVQSHRELHASSTRVRWVNALVHAVVPAHKLAVSKLL